MSTRLIVAWGIVVVPLAYGLVETIRKAATLFTG